MSLELVFTLDLEEWVHSENVMPFISGFESDHSSMAVMDVLLDFLDERQIKGTFFVLGIVAEKNPSLVKNIYARGHEIASHGWDHTLLHQMDRDSTVKDVSKSTALLEDLVGDKIVGYRSPCFSQNPYLKEILLKYNYRYTSMGIKSTFHDRYSRNPFGDENLPDFGLPVASLLWFNIPATGGGWFRLLPLCIQMLLLRITDQRPKVFYCHPWDFDDQQPLVKSMPILYRFRHSVNVRKAMKKLREFNFSCSPLRELL